MAKSENISFNEAERKIFGMCHAEAGGKLAEKWKFPPALVDAIKFHHEPRKSFQGRKLACIIHVADIITINGGVGVGGDGLRYQLDESSLKLLNIQEADFDQLILELHTGMKSIDDFVANSS
jgi:HD-like signal output (HDOD) protein